MISMIGRVSCHWQAALGLALAVLAAPASRAGVIDGVQTVDSLTIYLGVVPAAVVRGHAQEHPETRMHGGVPGRSIHNVHLVVALFDKVTGARITNAIVGAHIIEPGGKHGKQWSIPLEPMTVNGAQTFGGYTAFEQVADYRIGVRVQRPRRQPVTANFTYAHD